MYKIQFNIAPSLGTEIQAMEQALATGRIAGDNTFTKKCHTWLQNHFEVPRVLLTTSCTHALEMSALLANIEPNDEVIIPSFTFVSTANAFVLRGAKPVFIDIRPDTLNLDETQLAKAITERTKAIVPVHYAGVGCDMTQILHIADQHDIMVIEDNAHGLFGKYKDKFLGTWGAMATHSFHETKNFTCGEGGALFINDPKLIERAEIIREKGTNRSRFFRGEIDKYTWVDLGSSYLLADILAAFLYTQISAHEKIQNKRKKIWHYYYHHLHDWSQQNQFHLPIIPSECDQTYHMFYMLAPNLKTRQRLITHLKQQGILSVFHYLPLHLSDMGRKFGGQKGDCPVTEDISDRLLRLPFYFNMTDNDLETVVNAIKTFSLKE